MPPLLLALVSILASVAAQFALKAGMGSTPVHRSLQQGLGFDTAWTVFTQPMVVAGFALYAAGAVVWLGVLARWDVSKAYPLVGLGFVLTASVGWLLGENVTTPRLAGVLLIGLGVWLTSRS